MNWTELLKSEIEGTYAITDKLFDMVDKNRLDWKPSEENNWMTTGQLLVHICIACGAPMCGYVTGDWGIPEDFDVNSLLPEDVDINSLTPEEMQGMLPPAEKLPTVSSLSEAKDYLEEDRQLALDMLAECAEEKLANETASAPWDTTEVILGHRLLGMTAHLRQHTNQLFYYLKLQGKPVNTSHLW